MDRNTSLSLMRGMRLGWNLGNTFDAPAGETSWGNPVTTREMLTKIHSLGFNAVRIPVSWHRHTDPDFTIHKDWLERVAEAVSYAYDDGMYVIINIHHDDRMFQPTAEGFEGGKIYIKRIWEQLCERFEGFGDRLIFEALNEPRMLKHKYEWNLKPDDEECLSAVEYINRYDQLFVDTVRSSGGNNKTRFIMTPSYAAAPHHAFMPAFRVASDPADRLIISVHSYAPVGLCLLEDPAVNRFDERGEKDLLYMFSKLRESFIDKNIPVIIGEMGVIDKQNPDDRRRWAEFFVGNALKNEMVPIWWDNGGRDFRLFDRRNLGIYEESACVFEGLLAGAEKIR